MFGLRLASIFNCRHPGKPLMESVWTLMGELLPKNGICSRETPAPQVLVLCIIAESLIDSEARAHGRRTAKPNN
jgi:hypothetical protein